MIRELDLDFLVVTRGEKGMVLLDDTSTLEIPTQARDVFDVSGAGDTVIATLAGAMASGLSIEDSVRLSNLAAGVVVGKIGTSPVERDDLINALSETDVLPLHGKIYNDLADLLAKVNAWKDAGCSVIFTNGCFDVIHSGHVLYLEKAAREGDKLIVGVNSDESVKRLKGSSRPVNQEEDRMEVLAALSCVDAVIKFDEDTPLKLIDSIQPDVLVKGSDYTEEQVAGASQVKSRGGRVVLVPLLEGRSTTGIIEKIRSADMDSRKKHTS
jgi:D-beta-D-heptose 7-phosphate kinase/D-beta-D-heptose 1-phosphate adenosyltransferase